MSCLLVRATGAALATALLGGVAPVAALAADTAVVSGEVVTTQIKLEDSDGLTVDAGGTVDVSGDPAVYINNSDSGVVTITNAGTITSSDDRAIESDKDDKLYVTIVNEAGGTIAGADDAIKLKMAKGGAEGTVNIENSGTIISTGGGQAIDLDDLSDDDLSVTITNRATGLIQSTGADALRSGNGTVYNYGTIVSYDEADSSSDGIDLQANAGTIYNWGTISGARHGITADTNLTVTNYGTVTGRNGSGIGSDGDGTVINYGTITGTIDEVSENGDGDGVDIDGYGVITNYGTIEGTGAKGEKDGSANTSEGIAMGGGEITNATADAAISGADNGILIDDSDAGDAPYATTIVNHGTIEGLAGYGIRLVGDQDDTITNYGTISGANGLALDMGGGDDTLNVYTGATFMGTVEGGDGEDTINLDSEDDTAGTFVGGADFEYLNILAGSWTLTGDQSYSDDVSLSGGTIIVEGTLSVVGDYTQSSGTTYVVGVDADGLSGMIEVGGTATLAGTVSFVDASGIYSAGTSYTILTSVGTIATTFDDEDTPDDLPFLNFAVSYDTNSVTLDVTRSSTSFTDVSSTPNQKSVAGAVEALGAGTTLYDEITSLTTSDARQAFTALSGEAQASALSAMVLETADLRSIMNARVRGAFGNVSSAAVGTHGENPDAPLGLNTWARVYGAVGTVGGGVSSMDRTSAGIMAGLDMPFGDTFRAGLAVGYGRSFYDANALGSSSKADNFTIAAYGGAALGPVTFSFGAADTWHDIDSARSVAVGATSYRPRASYSANTIQVFGEADYAMPMGGVVLDPFAGLAYVGVQSDAYSETTIAGLSIDDETSNVGMTTLGLRVSSAFQILSGVDATISGAFGWRHAFGDIEPTVTAAFSGGDSFAVSGTPIADDAALVEAGLDISLTPDVHFDVSYSGQIADDSRDHSFAGRLSVRF